MKSSTVMIFGGGIEVDDNSARLSNTSQQRVSRFLRIFHEEPERFTAQGSYVLCTGGYGLLAAGIQPPSKREWREGHLMAAALMEGEVPHQRIEVEDESVSTLTNLTYSLRNGLIDPDDFSPEDPLGLVSHPYHLRRINDTAWRLGIQHTEDIPTSEYDDWKREMILRVLYRTALIGARTADELESRDVLIGRVLGALRGTD